MSTPPEEPLHSEVAAWLQRRAAGRAEPLGSFLSTTGFGRDAVGRVLAELDGTSADPTAAETFGRYRIGALLGRGGMGTVHLAHDTHLDREIALKRIRPELLLSAEARARFAAETKAVARLDHPHIGKVLDAGEQGGQPFLVFQFVRGRSLAGCLQAALAGDATAVAALTTERSLLLAEKIARALHHAHQHGLLHRDVKPSNILLGEDGEPYLIDFGLARAVTDAEPLTLPGLTPGTYRYMSPEQLAGRSDLDARTDVFSLGLCLAQALTLRHPFAAGTEVECVQAIQHAAPEFDGPRGRRLSNDLRRVLEVALAKDPARRYADARAFADDLARLRQHEPIVAVQPSSTRRAWLWARRHPWALAHGLVLLLLASVALAFVRSASGVERESQRLARATETLQALTRPDATPRLALARAVEAAESEAPHALDTLLWQRLDACGELYRVDRARPSDEILGIPTLEPGGARSAVLLTSGVLRVWRTADGVVLHEIEAHAGSNPLGNAAAVFHPTLPRLLTIGFDGLVKTWSTLDWRQQAGTSIAGPDAPLSGGLAIAVSPDGHWLAAGDSQGHLLLVDLHAGREQRSRVGKDAAVGGLDWCPQSQTLVVRLRPAGVQFDESIGLVALSAATGAELWRQDRSRDAVTALGWHATRRWLALGTARGRVEVLSGDDGALLASAQHCGHDSVVRWCGFAPGDDRLIAATPTGFANYAVSGSKLAQVHVHQHAWHRGLVAMAFGAGNLAAAMFRDGSFAYLDKRDWRTHRMFAAPPYATWSTALAWGDGGVLASRNTEVIAWSAPARAWGPQWFIHTGAITVVEALPADRRLLTAGVDGKVHIVDPEQGLVAVAEVGAAVQWARVSPGGRRVCLGAADRRIQVFDLASLRPFGATDGTLAEFLAEDSLVLVDGATVLRWDLAHGTRTKLCDHAGDVHALAVQPEAQLVWSGGADRNVSQTSTVDPRLAWVIPAVSRSDFMRGSQMGRVMAMRFLPDRDVLLVSAANDCLTIQGFGRRGGPVGRVDCQMPRFGGKIGVDPQERFAVLSDFGFGRITWIDLQASDPRAPAALSDRHTQTVTAIQFTLDGRLCLTASLDGTVQVWDVATQAIRSTLRLDGTTVHAACFTADGAWIATGDGRGQLRLWPVDPLPVARDYLSRTSGR